MNMKKKKAKQTLLMLAVMAVSVVIGAVMGLVVVSLIPEDASPAYSALHIVMLLVGLLAGALIQTVTHEAGHLVAGLLSGYRFLSFRIGSLLLIKSEGRLRLKRQSISGTAGQCLMVPPALVDGRMPVVLYNLGGVIFNLLLSTLLGVLAAFTPSWLSIALVCVAVEGGIFALLNGIPMKLATVNNDGSNAYHLSRTPKAAEAFWCQLQINAAMSEGKRARELPDAWFACPDEEGLKNSMLCTQFVFRCNRLLDQGRIEETATEIEALLNAESEVVGIYRQLLTLDLIYCKLIMGQFEDPILQKWKDPELQAICSSMKTLSSVLRTQYTYRLLFQKDKKAAAEYRLRFEKASKKNPYRGDVEGERELLQLADRVAAEGTFLG